jgi:chromate transport protein ChrA
MESSEPAVLARSFYDAGFGRFLVSPGFGGLATAAAALVAFLVWNSNRAAVKRQRWMDTLIWVYESTTAQDRVQMPYAVAIPILTALLEQARGSLEEQMVRGVTKMLRDRAQTGGGRG